MENLKKYWVVVVGVDYDGDVEDIIGCGMKSVYVVMYESSLLNGLIMIG